MGEIRIKWWDEKTERYRTAVGYIGEDGLLAGVAYCVRDGKFERTANDHPASRDHP